MEIQRTGGLDRDAFAGLGDEWAWFDNAGGSFTLRGVIDRVREYMSTSPVQLGARYALSTEAARRQREAVTALARFINAASPEEIVLGASSTALTWQVANALRPRLRPGDEILITIADHEANRSPWLSLRAQGVIVKTWEIDRENFQLSLAQLDTLLGERTRLVAFTQCSNITGTLEPVDEIVRRIHAAGALAFVDSVAAAAHRRLDVQASNADFHVCSLYKIFGPHIGMLYGRRDVLLELDNCNHEYLGADALPYKLQPGGPSYELAWGAAGIVDYFEDWQARNGQDLFAMIATHEQVLLAPLLDLLANHARVNLVGAIDPDSNRRLPIVSFRHASKSSTEITDALASCRLAAKHGHFHSRRLLEHLGIPAEDGVVRISLAHYNTPAEIQRLLDALGRIL